LFDRRLDGQPVFRAECRSFFASGNASADRPRPVRQKYAPIGVEGATEWRDSPDADRDSRLWAIPGVRSTPLPERTLFSFAGERLLGDDNEGTVDTSHPTDLGFMRQADAFAEVLGPILPAQTP